MPRGIKIYRECEVCGNERRRTLRFNGKILCSRCRRVITGFEKPKQGIRDKYGKIIKWEELICLSAKKR